jgi:hypothetical protein
MDRLKFDRNTIIMIAVLVALAWYFFFRQEENFAIGKQSRGLVAQARGIVTEYGALFYTDNNFKGRYIAVAPGQYNTRALKNLGLDDNTISSIKIEPGFVIQGFQNDNFRGPSVTFGMSQTTLPKNFNNQFSSLIIRAK